MSGQNIYLLGQIRIIFLLSLCVPIFKHNMVISLKILPYLVELQYMLLWRINKNYHCSIFKYLSHLNLYTGNEPVEL